MSEVFVFQNSAVRNHVRTVSLLNQTAHSQGSWLPPCFLGHLQDLLYPEALKMHLNRLLTPIHVSRRTGTLPKSNAGSVLCLPLVTILIQVGLGTCAKPGRNICGNLEQSLQYAEKLSRA